MSEFNWGIKSLDADKTICHSVGPLHIWIQKKGDEVWLGHRHSENLPDQYQPSSVPPEDLEWSRWALKKEQNELKLAPVFQDLPIVISSEFPLRVTPNNKIKIFTRVPIWVRISEKSGDYILTEIPTVPLSRTWFGTPLEGELCYWSTTKARRSLAETEQKPHLVNCPIKINNRADQDLDFVKFCYRVERLSIYHSKNELWAGETNIVYHGEEQLSDINMTGKLPEGVKKSELLSKPRKEVSQSLATRTFKKIIDETPFLGR